MRPSVVNPVEVSVVVVTHNRLHYLLPLLNSIMQNTMKPQEIIVVDNASTDGTYEAVTSAFPSVRFIRNPENYLVARACNIGIKVSQGRFILLIADDNVLAPGCIYELYATFQGREDAALVGPRMYFYDDPDRIWFANATLSLWTGLSHFPKTQGDPVVVVRNGIPNCFMVRRSVLETVGLLDDVVFPFHHEEADLYFRCRAAGYEAYVNPAAIEWHRVPLPGAGRVPVIGSGDFNVDDPSRTYLHARARPLLARRHASVAQRVCYFTFFFPLTVSLYCVIAFCSAKRGQRLNNTKAFLRGSLAGLVMALPKPPVFDAHCDPERRLPDETDS